MHEIIMVALYDRKAEIYDTPLFFLKEVQATRWFYQLVQEGQGRFQHFKNDMEVHKLARFNVLTGKVIAKDNHGKPEILIEGKQIGKEKENNEDSNAA